MVTHGIDVSKHQGMIDWSKVKTDFAILRAGFGCYSEQEDLMFQRNYEGAKAAGIPVGAYWYSYATTVEEARQEAKACLQVLSGKQFEYPIYVDIEDALQCYIEKDVLTAIAEAFCDTLEKAGYFAGVYASTYWFINKLDHARLAERYTIWLADYRAVYNKTLMCNMHQYTSGGILAGISGRVDMNICTLDFPSIIKKAGLNGYSETAAPNRPGLKTFSAQASPGDLEKLEQLAKSLKLSYKIE